ncbi:hypothetical protein ACFQUU_03375 [Herbaspirillum sp. GCM10030257]|uniref:hypothetical protein n=1 Tax=Herbaspirillum sp. GCM10030257 TaxID=3273393 RepID=UPI0036166D92
MSDRSIIEALQREAISLDRTDSIDRIVADIGDASIVLLGEATHGTQEFYRMSSIVSGRKSLKS